MARQGKGEWGVYYKHLSLRIYVCSTEGASTALRVPPIASEPSRRAVSKKARGVRRPLLLLGVDQGLDAVDARVADGTAVALEDANLLGGARPRLVKDDVLALVDEGAVAEL